MIDLLGVRYGTLVVERRLPQEAGKRIYWLCRCDCGGSRRVSGPSLRGGCASACVACLRAASKGRRRARGVVEQSERRAKLDALKAHPCVDCGRDYPPCVMDFDHVRGAKKYNINTQKMCRADLAEELAKCELRCANCHRLRHHAPC
ncbi:MAG: hypothetical protein V4864_25940 [Pseudomonadota bacterium]